MNSFVRKYDSPLGWSGKVAFASGPDGFAYRPGEVITGGDLGVDAANRMFPGRLQSELVFPEDEESSKPDRKRAPRLFLLRGDIDTIEAVESLRAEGISAQPNHVFFAHGDGCCPPTPAQRWAACMTGAFSGSPFHGSPFHGSPFHGSPFHGSPFHGSPFHGSASEVSEVQKTGRRRSSARPAAALPGTWAKPVHSPNPVKVAVLDTGMAADDFRPAALDSVRPASEHWEIPDEDRDGFLDSVAGHGTFIAGLIQLVAPGCAFTIERVLSNYGDGEEAPIARRIHDLAGKVDIINLSFGGYVSKHAHALASAVRLAQSAGTVVVASAGNDATCRLTYPAALPGVIGVGAVGSDGPAPFTNFGPWVRACAPGVDLVSWFFSSFDGGLAGGSGTTDPDHFVEWARWSGTSFSAPIVVAALAREMSTFGISAPAAVERVVEAPGLLGIPDLGTVINMR